MGRDISVIKKRTDISSAPLGEGDWVYIFDDAREEEFCYEVITELESEREEARKFKVKIINSTNPAHTPGSFSKLFIDRNRVVWGAIIRKNDRGTALSQTDRNNIAATELRKFLDGLPNLKAPYIRCIKYLVSINVFPKVDNHGKAIPVNDLKLIMRGVLQQVKDKDMLYTKGGVIFSTGRSYRVENASYGSGAASQVRRIDFRMYMQSQRLLLESGYHGPVELFNLD